MCVARNVRFLRLTVAEPFQSVGLHLVRTFVTTTYHLPP